MYHPTVTAQIAEAALERREARADELDDALQAEIERAHDALHFDDAIEMLAGRDDAFKTKLMIAFRTDRQYFRWLLDNAFEDCALAAAKEVVREKHAESNRLCCVTPVRVRLYDEI